MPTHNSHLRRVVQLPQTRGNQQRDHPGKDSLSLLGRTVYTEPLSSTQHDSRPLSSSCPALANLKTYTNRFNNQQFPITDMCLVKPSTHSFLASVASWPTELQVQLRLKNDVLHHIFCWPTSSISAFADVTSTVFCLVLFSAVKCS